MESKEDGQKHLDMRRKTIHDAEEFLGRHMRMDEFEVKEADIEVFGRLAHRSCAGKTAPERRADPGSG